MKHTHSRFGMQDGATIWTPSSAMALSLEEQAENQVAASIAISASLIRAMLVGDPSQTVKK